MALLLAKSLSALLPVVVHLLVLVAMDGYQLVRLRLVLLSVGCGVAAALASQVVNDAVLLRTSLDLTFYSPWIAPVVEELFKAAWPVWLVASRRVGFLVDGAILGFAVGVGFALTENLVFLTLRSDVSLVVWVIRGFGTAVMHGSTVALLAVLSQGARERHPRVRPWHFVPGLLLAVAVHSSFNQFLVSPALQAAGLVVGLPALMYGVFRLSDRSLQRWLGAGFATDAELLEAINKGQISGTPVGCYLLSLQERFPPTVVADMICLLRITAELSLEAKGLLLLRKQGFNVEPSEEVREKLVEVAFLEKSIGPTGRLAIGPLLPRGRRDFWQRQLLGG